MPAHGDERTVNRRSTAAKQCRHCGAPIAAGAQGDFCCAGCRAVSTLLSAERLDRYYELRGQHGQPVSDTRPESRSLAWLDVIEARHAAAPALSRIELDVQGIYCSGCVFLFEELFRRQPGGARILVNPLLGRVELTVDKSFPVAGYVTAMERFGYVLGPKREESEDAPPHSADALVRMGVCIAIAMNSMIFGISIYAGLDDAVLLRVFQGLNLGLACVSVAVGGWVFIRSAWRGLLIGHLHIDLPIAMGILLSFAGSTSSFFFAGSRGAYFDTLNVFIALMLVGRFLKERLVEKNRAQLRDGADIAGLPTKRVVDGRVEVAKLRDVRAGDKLLLGPNDIVPTSARLEDEHGSFSLDWISGESAPQTRARGDTLPAGACVVCATALVTTLEDFQASSLLSLLPGPSADPTPHGDLPQKRALPTALTFWPRLAKHYVAGVIGAATLGFTYWYLSSGSLTRAIDVVTAVLTVTCPCAFGIATPLAYELVYARLRRLGLLIRRPGFLDRATTVQRVVFDKTGTLTTGVMKLVEDGALEGLDRGKLDVLYNLVVRSAHPKSIAIKRALDTLAADRGLRFDERLAVTEQPGKGLSLVAAGHVYRLGEPAWATSTGVGAERDVVFSVDGSVCASFATMEALRPDASDEVRALQTAGYDVWILSGDSSDRVRALAQTVGIPENRTVAECSPEDKAEWLRVHDDHDTLMVGDGLNDGLAVTEAHCSGTPAIDRPFIAARSDFYLVTSGLTPVRQALEASRVLRRVVQRNLALAIGYNTLAAGLAIAGRMSPLLCAILMPLSSLTVILSTTASLSATSRTQEPLHGNHPAAGLREPHARRRINPSAGIQCKAARL
jgi:Cu2+-exporting ATPase